MTPAPLAGQCILVTRPQAQAAGLAARIAALGGEALVFPVLDIDEVADPGPLLRVIDQLDDFDYAVFVSPNAVDRAMAHLSARRTWPAGLVAACVGKSSEQALARHGVGRIIAPQTRYDSEALLALPELAASAVAGRKVVIFRGDGGRELLADTLRQRGASVTYAACYRRGQPAADVAPLLARWAGGTLAAVTLTSSEGLRNFHAMLGPAGQAWLKQTPVFVPHARIADAARALGLGQVILTGPADEGLVAGLLAYFAPMLAKPASVPSPENPNRREPT